MDDKFESFTSNTSLHGIRVIGDRSASRVRRVIWGILLAAGFGIVVYKGTLLTLRTIYPNVQTGIVRLSGLKNLKLPAITICNMNVYRKSYLDQHPEMKNTLHRLWEMATENPVVANISIRERIKEAAHQIDEMVPGYWYNNKVNNDTSKFIGVQTGRGYCYTFNSNKSDILYATLPGEVNGIRIMLNVQYKEHCKNDVTPGTSGFKVLLHEADEIPIMSMQGFAVAPGEETFVSIQRVKYTFEKTMDCYDIHGGEFVNPLQYFPYYSKMACQEECLIKYMEKSCGCSHPLYIGGLRECVNIKGYRCSMKAMGYFAQDDSGVGSCQCPEVCEKTVYDTKLSHALFPAHYVLDQYVNSTNMTTTELRENLSLLTVYYEELAETIVTQTYSYDIELLGGDIGGYMGLMFGASILTCLEIVEFLIMTCRIAGSSKNVQISSN